MDVAPVGNIQGKAQIGDLFDELPGDMGRKKDARPVGFVVNGDSGRMRKSGREIDEGLVLFK